MRGEGGRGGRSNRGGRYRQGSTPHHHYPYYQGNSADKGDHGSGEEESYSKETSEKLPRNKDGNRLLTEDSRLLKQLRRLSKEDNAERYLDYIEQLQDSIMLNENLKYVRRNAEVILDCLFENLHVAPSKACKWEVAQCVGQVGHVMKGDVDRFVDKVFFTLDKWKHKEHKVLVLRCLFHLFSLDTGGHQLNQVGDKVVEGLHFVLERTETMEVMVATVDILRKIYLLSPPVLSKDFQDIVDILVGWHIDHSQLSEVTNYVSLSLQSFSKLWLMNIPFAITLLSQFVEDMEDYLEETQDDEEDDQHSNEESKSESNLNAKKVAAFISAFTTILRCLGIEADPISKSNLSQAFLLESLNKMFNVTKKLFEQRHEESILHSLNQLCVVLLSLSVDNLMSSILSLVELNKMYLKESSYATQLSLLVLLRHMIQQMGSLLTLDFIQTILRKDSILCQLRMSPHVPIWEATLKVYHAVFALKNIPLLQEAYKYILFDLQKAHHTLLPDSSSFVPTSSLPEKENLPNELTEKEAEILVSYHITILAEVANTRNSIITMWALTPSLVELLGTHLTPSSQQLASRHPQVQQNILYLLYSHSVKHSHYISSSSLVVGASTKFIPSTVAGGFSTESPPFASVSSTSENLSTILNTITAVLKLRKVASADVLRLCIEWAMEIIIGCESSLPQLMQRQPFRTLISAVVELGYHFIQPVSLSVVQCLSNILSVLPFNQMHCLEDIVQLCLYNISHTNENIRRTYFELLSCIPLSTIALTLNTHSPLSKREYSSNKGDTYESIELCNVDCKTVVSLQRHYFLHSTPQLSATAFHTIISFLLQSALPKEERWMEDIFIVSQRVDRMTKPEDWSFSVLAPQLKILQGKWLVWEAAQYCVANKLKTTLGKPGDTFTSIEGAIKHHAKDVKECGLFKDFYDEKTKSEDLCEDSPKLLPVILLLEFIESLEKVMFNASDGCAVVPQPANKSVRIFFTTNRPTCLEWLNRIRAAVMTVALNTGQPHVALRHSYKLLKDLQENNNTEGADFERALCYCVKALIAIQCEDAIYGLYYWTKNKVGCRFPWIKVAALSAADQHEKALDGLLKCIQEAKKKETPAENGTKQEQKSKADSEESNQATTRFDPFVYEFLTSQIFHCHKNLNQWDLFKQLAADVLEKQETESFVSISGDLNFLHDLSHVNALSDFDGGNIEFSMMNQQQVPLPADLFQPKSWPLWRKMQNIDDVLFHIFSSVAYPLPDTVINVERLLMKCESEVEQLLQFLHYSPHSLTQLQLLLSIQVLCQLKSIFSHQSGDSTHLHESWEANLRTVPYYFLHQICRWTKLFARINQNVSEASITKLDLFSIKNARKRENFVFAEKNLLRLVKGKPSKDLATTVLEFPVDAEFTVLTSKLHREVAKLLSCTSKVADGCEVLANIVTNLNPVLATLASQDPSLLSLPMNEAGQICARSLLNLNKWWNHKEKKTLLLNPEDKLVPPTWMTKCLPVYLHMKRYIPEELQGLAEISHPVIPILDAHMGHLLTLAAIQCPSLPKVWYHLASWAFRWGRHVLNHNEGNPSGILHPEDVDLIKSILSPVIPADVLQSRIHEVCSLLGSSRRKESGQGTSTDDEEEDLRLEEVEGSQQLESALSHMLYEWGVGATYVNTLVTELLQVRTSTLRRDHAVLTSSAKAYFKFLKIGVPNADCHTDQQMIATLRLLRLIVKHASELQEVLEKGLAQTPTAPWKTIIPQLFARLSHPEPYVRGSISDLLCRLARDCPHLIIFPAVVGSSGAMSTSNQASFSDMLDKYFHHKKRKGKASEKKGGTQEADDDNYEHDEEEGMEGSDEEEEEEEKNDVEEEEEDVESYVHSSEDQQKKTLMQNCFSTLVNTLKKQLGGSIAEVQTLVHELRRITVLWDELWLGTLTQHHVELTRKCQQLKSDIAKLNRNASLSQTEKEQLVKKKYEIVFKPLVFVLDQVIEITSAHPETPHEKTFQETFRPLIDDARQSLISPENIHEPSQSVSKLRHLHQVLQQRAQKRSATSLKMAEVSPILANLVDTKIAMPGLNSPSSEIVTISSVGSSISVLPTKTKPKKLSFQGSDGKRYTYLFKGLEDLHLDQRIMQFLSTVNTMLSKNQSAGDAVYRAHYYSVVPLGARSGLIQWVGNATPLFGLYKRWQQREVQFKALKNQSAGNNQTQMPHIPRPSDLYYGKLSPRLKEAGVSVESRKDWPVSILREVFLELVKETPSDLLSRELWQTSIDASEWWRITHTYNLSTAVMSIVGYIIGLGDRHLDNLLVNLTSGEVIHIDYNVCFEKGKNLRVPERVPYRMTQNIEDALGTTGVEGIFRSACEHILRTMRKGRETLLTLLEAFIYDPLVDWTPDSEAGYAGAVYGGDQALVTEARQNRQHLEKALTVSIFTVRLAEMKADWVSNKNEVLDSIPRIISDLEKWHQTHQALAQAETKLQEGHYLMAMIKEAEANPQHNLYGLLARYKEYTIVKQTLQNANELLVSKMNELKDWQMQYKMADKIFKGTYIGEIRSKLINIGPMMSTVAPVKEYIATAGQSQLANQCEHSEVELRQALSQIVSVCLNVLEPISKYGHVWVNYPSDHLEKHRISRHYTALTELYENLSLENVQVIISKSHQDLADDPMQDSHLANVESHLHSKSINLNAQLQKLYDIIQEEGLSSSVITSHQESLNAINTFVTQQGEEGVAAVHCALLNSLSQSLAVRLREDKAVSNTAENLSDMRIGNLWWFSESLVSLGMVSELVNLLVKYSPPSIPSETSVIKAFNVFHDVFISIQDLIFNTSHIIAVEGGRLLWLQDSSVINIASRLQEVVAESSVPLSTLCQHLTHHLHMTIFRMPSTYESSVEEANNLHRQLLTLIQQMTDTSFTSDSNEKSFGSLGATNEMSQGQMLLMGFHLLFETVDTQIDRLVEALAAAPLPHPWPRVDMIRLSTTIMGPVYDQALREVVRAFLRVKKVQTITSFFTQALHLFADPNKKYNQGISTSEEEQLCRIVRSYAGECIFRLLLGLPSYLATHLLLIHIQKLGVNVTGYIECHDVGTEGRVPLEGLVEEALDRCITQKNLQSVIAQAASTVSSYLTTTRKKLLLSHWESEVEGVKLLLQRVTFQRLSHHWYYEEKLKQRVLNFQLQPNRSSIISELRKMESTFLALHQNITEMREKHSNLTGNILHRLKWAAGSNPSIGQALEDFSKSIDLETNTVSEVLRACEEVRSLCRAICHYETLRITSVEALTEDNHFTTILNKTQESCMLTQRYPGAITSQEELLILICPLPEEITTAWVQESATAVSEHLSSLTHDVGEHGLTLKSTESDVRSSIDDLRHHLTAHHKLMSDVRVLLKSLAKFEQEGGLEGIDSYLGLYRRYSEVMSGVVRQLLQESLSPEKVVSFTQKLQQLLLQTYVIYDKLVEFGTQCTAAEESQKESSFHTSKDSGGQSRLFNFSLKRGSSLFTAGAPKVKLTDVPPRINRHPVTGKVVQEHNAYALNVWRRVKTKLEGRDLDSGKVASVTEQVAYTIKEACSIDNLSTLYEGWTPWV